MYACGVQHGIILLATPNVPLCPLPLIAVPFERTGLDLAIREVHARVMVVLLWLGCVSSGGLFNVICGSSASAQHLSMQCCGCTLVRNTLSWNPTRNSD